MYQMKMLVGCSAHTCNPSSRKVETGELGVQSHPLLKEREDQIPRLPTSQCHKRKKRFVSKIQGFVIAVDSGLQIVQREHDPHKKRRQSRGWPHSVN